MGGHFVSVFMIIDCIAKRARQFVSNELFFWGAMSCKLVLIVSVYFFFLLKYKIGILNYL